MSRYTVAVVQSSYIPWKGYFDLIGFSDAFVFFDDRQFTRRDWRNRNRIKTTGGPAWLTIPVRVHGRYHQRIDEVELVDDRWAERHLKTIRQAYAGAPFIEDLAPWLAEVYSACAPERFLSRVNRRFISDICDLLGIDTPLTSSTDYSPTGDATSRILSLCRELGAERYLSGPAAQSYLDVEMFAREDVEVVWMDYSGYPEYPQPHGPFDHHVSIVDTLLSVGPRETGRHLKSLGGCAGGA